MSSVSPIFRDIFVQNPNKNPIIYFKDVCFVDLEMVVKFMHFGQCEVSNDDLENFFVVGKSLEVEGLMDGVHIENVGIPVTGDNKKFQII